MKLRYTRRLWLGLRAALPDGYWLSYARGLITIGKDDAYSAPWYAINEILARHGY